MRAQYSRTWNFLTCTPIDPMSEHDAKAQYMQMGTITVAMFEPDELVPRSVLEISPGIESADVSFFDATGRVVTSYAFKQIDSKLFMDGAWQYTYDSSDFASLSQASSVQAFYFKPDSDVVEVQEDKRDSPTMKSSERHGVDVSGNWEKIPEFGQWESLIRFER